MEKYQCPDNKDHKKFRSFGESTTLMGFSIEYDDQGRPLNADPNRVNEIFQCIECDAKANKCTRGWEVTFTDAKDREYLAQDLTPEYLK